MNNNYHTQLNSQNSMINDVAANRQNNAFNKQNSTLNEIAANRHLTQMPVYHGTPINNFNIPQNLVPQNHVPQNHVSQNHVPQNHVPQNHVPQNSIDELELSDKHVEQVKSVPAAAPTPKDINKEVQRIIQTNKSKKENESKSKSKSKSSANHQLIQPTRVPEKKKSKFAMNYIVIPIILLITFFLLLYPKTSGMIDKFASIDTNKGIFVRGIILVVVYLVITFLFRKN